MNDSHSTLSKPSLRNQPYGSSPGARLVKLLANPILLATLACSSQACPPLVPASHCKHNPGYLRSHGHFHDCRPIGTWTMVRSPNSFPACGPCGCSDWQSDWISPYASNPSWFATQPNTATSPQALSQPSNDAVQPKPSTGESPIQKDRSATDQPNWRPPTSQVPNSPLPPPDDQLADPGLPKPPTNSVPKVDDHPVKELELLFGDPPTEAPVPSGDPSQSRWVPRNGDPQGNGRTTRYANAPSTPLDQQEWRNWTDHTGSFRIRARLIEVGPFHLVLLKENGRTTTLPISRLSTEDAVYLRLGK
jgi:hypothetical protein